jgi:hypothetical protein
MRRLASSLLLVAAISAAAQPRRRMIVDCSADGPPKDARIVCAWLELELMTSANVSIVLRPEHASERVFIAGKASYEHPGDERAGVSPNYHFTGYLTKKGVRTWLDFTCDDDMDHDCAAEFAAKVSDPNWTPPKGPPAD